jgi:hypothetical protein
MFSAMTVAAETAENFNSRKGVAIPNVKAKLQNSCWTFHNFDVNQDGWNPQIEGDGAMVANLQAMKYNYSGIYTPVLNVPTNISISFDYVFSNNFSSSSKRWMKVCLANANNEIIQVLETVDFIGAGAKLTKKYSTEFRNITPGEYRLVLQYGGTGETARIAVDDLKISAPFKYESGCNNSPVILKSKITGRPDRTAFGSLLLDEKNANDNKLNAYLIKGSSHGEVKLNADGTFIFTPNKGFEGTSTSFVYKVCEDGAGNLCSANTTVNIEFPNASTSLVDFKGSYKYNGNVELIWNTALNNTITKFSLERSFDGHKWEYAGTVSNNPDANIYAYIDNVGKGAALKRDIYYRLKQTNADGNMLVSKLLIVRVYNSKTLTMISVTPNPSVNDITANVQLQESSYVSMRVMNKEGKAVIRKVVEAAPGLNTFTVDGSSKLEPGAYILELIVNSNERMLVKLIKE